MSEEQCPKCGAKGILHGLFYDEPAVREVHSWYQCAMCGYTWKKKEKKTI